MTLPKLRTNISLPLVIFQFVSQKHGLFKQSVCDLATFGRQNLSCSTE